MASGADEPATGKNVSLGIPPALVEDMDRFIAEHPEFGIQTRNEFARRAIADMLRTCWHEVGEREALAAFKAGKPGPWDAMKRMKPK